MEQNLYLTLIVSLFAFLNISADVVEKRQTIRPKVQQDGNTIKLRRRLFEIEETLKTRLNKMDRAQLEAEAKEIKEQLMIN